MSKPKLEFTPAAQPQVKAGSTPGKKHWRFSFRFWRQIDFFGLDQSKPSWFVSLLDKLTELSKEEFDSFLTDSRKREAYRFHEINWAQPGIPIAKTDFTWVHANYISNNEDYRFYQFQISAALGRVVGFIDEANVFNIVLLDPLHNAQPTKFDRYKVKPCSPLPNDFAILLSTLQRVADTNWCKRDNCAMRKALNEIREAAAEPGVIIMNLPAEIYKKVSEIMQSEGIGRLEEFFQYGIMAFEEEVDNGAETAP